MPVAPKAPRPSDPCSKYVMNWVEDILNQLAGEPSWSYRAGGALAAEPLSLASLALSGYGRADDARRASLKLTQLQGADGSVGITLDEPTPGWPTSFAVLAWAAGLSRSKINERASFQQPIERGVRWLLSTAGDTSIRNPDIGHNAALCGWPWAEGTHSWIEPTATSVLALKATGYADHPRTREAVALLIDRLLPSGGCNYGNTTVLGQTLLPQPAPSGLALAALMGERDPSGRIGNTIGYLQATLSAQTPSLSLAYGLIGLAAHGAAPRQAGHWLELAARRTGREAAPHKRALVALAALGGECPLLLTSFDARVDA